MNAKLPFYAAFTALGLTVQAVLAYMLVPALLSAQCSTGGLATCQSNWTSFVSFSVLDWVLVVAACALLTVVGMMRRWVR